MKKIFIVVVPFFLIIPVFAQQGQLALIDSALIPRPYLHYQQEYAFDKSIDPGRWQGQKALHVSFASTDEAYFRTEVPGISQAQSWAASGWKGERLNMMVLVWSADTINQLRVLVNDLRSRTAKNIKQETLGKKLDLSKSEISRIENGKRETKLAMLKKIAIEVGVSASSLIED